MEQADNVATAQLEGVAWQHARGLRNRLAEAVIHSMRACKPFGVFDDAHPRSVWDEFCWGLQEGVSDDPVFLAGQHVGSMASGFDAVLEEHLAACCAAESHETLVFLSFFANERALSPNRDLEPNAVWMEGIYEWVGDEVKHRASIRDLSYIGPDRVEAIAMEITWPGFMLRQLAVRDLMTELLSENLNALLDEGDDLADFGEAALDVFMELLEDDQDGSLSSEIIAELQPHIRKLLLEQDLAAALVVLRKEVLATVNEQR